MTEQQYGWDDERIDRYITRHRIRMIGSYIADVWFIDSGLAHNILRKMRDDLTAKLRAKDELIHQAIDIDMVAQEGAMGQDVMTPDELAEHTQQTTNGHHQERAEGKDLLEAAIISVEKAVYWGRPETYHEGMYEDGVKIATLRANVALAVEVRALRKEMEAFRLGVMMDLRRAREG